MIPQRLGRAGAARVAYVDVTLTSEKLRDLTVVDTPGLASTDTQVSARARRASVGEPTAPFDAGIDADSAAEVAAAEAVVYVFTQAVRADDVQALEAFRAASARLAQQPDQRAGRVRQGRHPGRRGRRPVAGRRVRSPSSRRRCSPVRCPRWCRWWGCSPRPARRAG